MEFVKFNKDYFEDYFLMSKALFPDYSKKDLQTDLEYAIASEKHEAFFAKDEDQLIGFVNVSLRTDYVEGATSSPVGYLEALYIKDQYRKKGSCRQALCYGRRMGTVSRLHTDGVRYLGRQQSLNCISQGYRF